MRSCWIRGLRPPRSHAPDWRPVAARCLLSEFSALGTGEKAAAAEDGLGLGRCTYFYLARVEVDFAELVVAYRPERLPGAVAPFDTGGVFHGHEEADPTWRDHGHLRAFVASNSYNLPATEDFEAWLGRAYADPLDYARGRRPQVPLDPIVYAADPRAWTWEVRVQKPAAHGTPTLERVFCSSTQQRHLIEWAQDHLDPASCVRLADVLTQRATIGDPPSRVDAVIQWLEAP